MYVKQADILAGLDKPFVARLMKVAIQIAYPTGTILFNESDPAQHFYILLSGRIRISIGEKGHTVMTVSNAGECFGWSSLVGAELYSAAAVCSRPTRLLRFGRDRLQAVLYEDPHNAFRFYRNLAQSLGHRVRWFYQMLNTISALEAGASHGSGQVQQIDEAI